jgi:phosphotransacetylase
MLLRKLAGGTVVGPFLTGFAKSAQIVRAGATVSEIVNTAVLATLDTLR